MFFDCIKKKNCDFVISPDVEEIQNEEEFVEYSLEHVKKTLMQESQNDNDKLLADIEEETEEQLEEEAFDFQNSSSTFDDLASKINLVILKIKKVVTIFNCSNNLNRALLHEQKERPLNLLSDMSNKRKKFKCALQLIQDIITR
jgi:hypothetical protein